MSVGVLFFFLEVIQFAFLFYFLFFCSSDSQDWIQVCAEAQLWGEAWYFSDRMPFFFCLSLKMGCDTVNSKRDKEIETKKHSGAARYTCFLLPPSALCSTRRSCRPAWAQTVLMHNIYHRGSSARHPGLITPPIIKQESGRTLSQEQPEIRSVL